MGKYSGLFTRFNEKNDNFFFPPPSGCNIVEIPDFLFRYLNNMEFTMRHFELDMWKNPIRFQDAFFEGL